MGLLLSLTPQTGGAGNQVQNLWVKDKGLINYTSWLLGTCAYGWPCILTLSVLVECGAVDHHVNGWIKQGNVMLLFLHKSK